MALLLSIIFSSLLLGSLLILKDLPFVEGTILASGAGERWSVRILTPILLLGGMIVPIYLGGSPSSETLVEYSTSGTVTILAISLATFLAVKITGRFSRFPAIAYAFMAAIAGTTMASGNRLNASLCASYALSWIAAPLLCAALAAGIYRIYAISTKNRTIHLAVLDARLLAVSTLLAFLLLAVTGYNSSLVLAFLPSNSGLPILAQLAIVVGCAMTSYLILSKRVSQRKWDIADSELDINSQSVLAVLMAMVITLVLFSGNIPGLILLTATPVPPGTMFVAALAGISVSRNRALVEGKDITSSVFAIFFSPALAMMAAFCITKVAGDSLTGIIFILTLFLLAVTGSALLRSKEDKEIQNGIMLSRERQAFSTQKTLSALEVKAEMTEKDLLDKLDGKRKELVDFALGIGDQKKFMEKIYDDLKDVRSMEDGPDKDARTDELLSSLRERMYFTSEINDFYARSEILHKDFNRRLAEAFPNLTENERKLANLLRQGFSSKYIASLMNIAPKSVEINRYRLRAKLGLRREDNLIKFIKSI